jgi:hypothetical protein
VTQKLKKPAQLKKKERKRKKNNEIYQRWSSTAEGETHREL